MPIIKSVGLGRPQGYYSQEQVFAALGHRPIIKKKVFEAAGIRGRPLYCSPEVAVSRSPQEQQDGYAEAVLDLSRLAILQALERGGVRPEEIGRLAFHSCTGVPACPSFPSVLGGMLGLPQDCLFLPLHGIGCQGVGPVLRVVWDWLRLNSAGKGLALAVEISQAAYHPKMVDDGKVNRGVILGNAIFGDGASCALMVGMGKGLSILDFAHYTDFQLRDKIGMEWVEGRYRLVLDTDVPELVAARAQGVVLSLLKKAGLIPQDISHFIIHSGGAAIIEQFQKALKLKDEQVRFSWENWHEVGNLSSATLLFVLDKLLASDTLKAGDNVVMVTIGAGVEVDAILGYWNG